MIILRQNNYSKRSEALYKKWEETGDDKDAYEFMNAWTEDEYIPARKNGIFKDPRPSVVKAAGRYQSQLENKKNKKK